MKRRMMSTRRFSGGGGKWQEQCPITLDWKRIHPSTNGFPGLRKILWDGIGNLSPKVVGHIFVAISLANNCTYCAGAGCSVLAGRGESKYSLKYRTDEAKLRAFLRDVD